MPTIQLGATLLTVNAPGVFLDQPFPLVEMEIGRIHIQGPANGIPIGPVTFSASGHALSGLGIYRSSASLCKILDLDPAIDFPHSPESHSTVLRWGLNATAAASGAVALAPAASVTISGDAASDALYAVVRRFDDATLSGLEEITGLINSWTLPAAVHSPSDLEPGTSIVCKVNGHIGLKLGVQYGLNYNWLRFAKSGGWTGDLGLKLQLGIDAALGFTASGAYTVILGRESIDPKIRLRIFKTRASGWDFALHAGLVGNLAIPLRSQTPDDFIRAIFGVHPSQLVADLETLAKWNGSAKTLEGVLANVGLNRSLALLHEVTGIDPKTAFSAAQKQLKTYLSTWNNLSHDVSSLLLHYADGNEAIRDIKARAAIFASGNDAQIADTVASLIGTVGFFQTPGGQFLDAIASGNVFGLLNFTAPQLETIRKTVANVTAVLDGSQTENFLRAIQNQIVHALNLEPIAALSQQAEQLTLDRMDTFLKAKLASFLGKQIDSFHLQDLEKIRKLLQFLLTKRASIYQEAAAALNRGYKMDFAATYQSATTNTALLDITFDFAVMNPALPALLQDAIGGRFEDVLMTEQAGVIIGKAALTHQLKRHTHQELNMPWGSSTDDHAVDSLASCAPLEDNGRVFVYDARATDAVSRHTANMARNSSLTIASHIAASGASSNNVRVHSVGAIGYTYSLRQANRQMSPTEFDRQITGYVNTYFAALPGQPAPKLTQPGNVLLNLDISLPASASAPWLLPLDSHEADRLSRVSVSLQRAMRQLVATYYFQDPACYEAVGVNSGMFAVLAYSLFGARRNGATTPDDGELEWLLSRISSGDGDSALGRKLTAIQNHLQSLGKTATAAYYENTAINLNSVLSAARSANGRRILNHLFIAEADVVAGAIAARRGITRSLEANGPEATMTALAEFGARIGKTFNHDVIGAAGLAPEALRPFGTIIYLEAARALSGEGGFTADVMLDVTILKDEVDPLAASRPVAGQIVSEFPLVIRGVRIGG